MLKTLIAVALITVFPIVPTTHVSRTYQPDPGRVAVTLDLSYTEAQKTNVKFVCEGLSSTFKGIQSNDPYEWDVYMCMNPEFTDNFDADQKSVSQIWQAPPAGTTVWGKALILSADPKDPEKIVGQVTPISSTTIR
jgi:hypothetical protein